LLVEEEMMVRKLAIALAAAAAIGTAFASTEALAHGGGHGGGHGGFHGGFHGRGFGPGFGFGVYPYYEEYPYDYGEECYQLRRVRTPHGWRLRRVWVCN
jgi:hypothetical protein